MTTTKNQKLRGEQRLNIITQTEVVSVMDSHHSIYIGDKPGVAWYTEVGNIVAHDLRTIEQDKVPGVIRQITVKLIDDE
jgi:hypothetical protein